MFVFLFFFPAHAFTWARTHAPRVMLHSYFCPHSYVTLSHRHEKCLKLLLNPWSCVTEKILFGKKIYFFSHFLVFAPHYFALSFIFLWFLEGERKKERKKILSLPHVTSPLWGEIETKWRKKSCSNIKRWCSKLECALTLTPPESWARCNLVQRLF